MAGELTITASEVALVRKVEAFEAVAGEDLTAGQLVRYDGSTGKVVKAAASSAANLGYRIGIALKSVKSGRAITVLAKGIITLGTAPLSSVAWGAPIYASDTAGSIATSAGTVSKILGAVEAVWAVANGVPDKLLRIDL